MKDKTLTEQVEEVQSSINDLLSMVKKYVLPLLENAAASETPFEKTATEPPTTQWEVKYVKTELTRVYAYSEKDAIRISEPIVPDEVIREVTATRI